MRAVKLRSSARAAGINLSPVNAPSISRRRTRSETPSPTATQLQYVQRLSKRPSVRQSADCETFRIPPLMLRRTTRIPDVRGWRRRAGLSAFQLSKTMSLIWQNCRLHALNLLLERSVNYMLLCRCLVSRFIDALK